MESQLSTGEVETKRDKLAVTTSTHAQDTPQPVLTAAERTAITQMVASLRRASPVQEIAADILEGKPVASMEPLLEVLRGHVRSLWRERAVAAWAVGMTAAPEDIAAVVPVLCEVLDHRREKGARRIALLWGRRICVSWFASSVTVGFVFGLVFILGLLFGQLPSAGDDFGMAPFEALTGVLGLGLFIFLVNVPFSVAIERDRIDSIRKQAAKSLGRLSLPSAISALCRATEGFPQDVPEVASSSLRIVLSKLHADHLGRIDSESVPSLCRVLPHVHAELALPILDALEKVGDGRAVQAVDSAAKRGWTPEIRKAATELLPRLLQRRNEENAPGVLLRASQEDLTSARELLRSTQDAPGDSPEELLRPNIGD